MDFVGKSREEIEAIITAAQAELGRRTQVWEVEQTRAWAERELGRLAANIGPIPANQVPADGFMPGQVVDTGDGLFLNDSGSWVHYGPRDEPISAWTPIEEEPEPDPEPEPEPGPAEPDYEEWEQPHAGSEYDPDAHVLHHGHLWRNDLGAPNGFEPGAPHSGWTDLGEYGRE